MSDFSFERLPMLDIIGSRLAGCLPVGLGAITDTACEASFSQLEYVPLGQALSTLPDSALIAIASSPVLEGDFLIVMDSPLVITSLESSLGGKAGERDPDPVGGFTAIEHGFAKQLASQFLTDLRQSFSVIADLAPSLSSIVIDAESATITQQANLCIRLDFDVKVGSQLCRLILIFSYDSLEPIRAPLLKIHFGDNGEDESPWRAVLAQQIETATIDLEVVLSSFSMSMRKIMSLGAGDQIVLSVSDESASTIVCSGTPLFLCETGKRMNGSAAVRITEEINLK